MKKNYNKNKWYPGQRVMFLDDRRHTSDELLKGMPRRGEICTVRRVLGITSQDTGERGIGLYLVGYHNPCEDGSWEYCYEAERFLPLRLIEALLANEISWRPEASTSCSVVIGLHEFFGIEKPEDTKYRRN